MQAMLSKNNALPVPPYRKVCLDCCVLIFPHSASKQHADDSGSYSEHAWSLLDLSPPLEVYGENHDIFPFNDNHFIEHRPGTRFTKPSFNDK